MPGWHIYTRHTYRNGEKDTQTDRYPPRRGQIQETNVCDRERDGKRIGTLIGRLEPH